MRAAQQHWTTGEERISIWKLVNYTQIGKKHYKKEGNIFAYHTELQGNCPTFKTLLRFFPQALLSFIINSLYLRNLFQLKSSS